MAIDQIMTREAILILNQIHVMTQHLDQGAIPWVIEVSEAKKQLQQGTVFFPPSFILTFFDLFDVDQLGNPWDALKIYFSTPNHFGEPLESTSKSIILDDLDIVELDSVDDFDIRSQDSRKSRRSRPKSMRSINDVIEEKIEQEVERRVREEVAQLREQVEQELSLNKQKSILKEKSLRFDH